LIYEGLLFYYNKLLITLLKIIVTNMEDLLDPLGDRVMKNVP